MFDEIETPLKYIRTTLNVFEQQAWWPLISRENTNI